MRRVRARRLVTGREIRTGILPCPYRYRHPLGGATVPAALNGLSISICPAGPTPMTFLPLVRADSMPAQATSGRSYAWDDGDGARDNDHGQPVEDAQGACTRWIPVS